MTGFFIYNYESRFAEAETAMARWIKNGLLRVTEDVMDGFENMPEALSRLYDAKNAGIQICRIKGEPAKAVFRGDER
jgi:NADPH-dependent curcumin reductase CurA